MNIIKWIKGKIKQKEVQNLEPDKDFIYDRNYYGDINITESFKFTYMNNYTDKYYEGYHQLTSFLSFTITLKNNIKTILDLINLMNTIIDVKDINRLNYKFISYDINKDSIILYLRGDIKLFDSICSRLYNNIITKYIRNNLFVNGIFKDNGYIETPNEYLDNMINSIKNPDKEIDILFIEDNLPTNKLSPVIGLSINKSCDKISLKDKTPLDLNNRNILYCDLENLSYTEIEYLRNNITYGNKIPKYVHNSITIDGIDLNDVDEIIEN